MTMNIFREAIRGVRTAFTVAIDVSNLLLGELQDRDVITHEQHDEIWVRCFQISLGLQYSYFITGT